MSTYGARRCQKNNIVARLLTVPLVLPIHAYDAVAPCVMMPRLHLMANPDDLRFETACVAAYVQ